MLAPDATMPMAKPFFFLNQVATTVMYVSQWAVNANRNYETAYLGSL
jgi:hypothetical protein